ncbi:hypothetical protein JG687_00004422 [Phytophthora cactorum]|uniref:EF-hand domain-containing protein n=1 Tax=Phytophthora cactorum TaxID=29920 RepID=A0A8T1UR95_9STRA|nr:hypothetical protein JG687_00004422 [Phytophthora cactorum]
MGNLLTKCGLATKHSQEKAFNRALHLNDKLLQTLRELGLNHKHLVALYQIFSAMDKDKSGEINMLEFFDYIDLKRSRFSEKAFSVMDRNGSGEVDFIEFVLAVWNYCSFNHASLVRFAFDLYDVDGSGEIEHDEVVRCVREMEIQRKVLGKRFWSRAAEKRGSINVAALNWDHVKEVTLISRKTSSKLLTSMEEDLDAHLSPAQTTKVPILLVVAMTFQMME